MKLSKTRIALAVSLIIGLHGQASAAWWDGGDYTTTQTADGNIETITGNLTISTDEQNGNIGLPGLVITNGANITAGAGVNIKIEVDAPTVNNQRGVQVNNGSTLDLREAESVEITSNNRIGSAVDVGGTGSTVYFGDGRKIEQTNDWPDFDRNNPSHAVYVGTGGTAIFGDRNEISTYSAPGAAVFASGTGASATLGDGNILTGNGTGGHAAFANNGGSITMGDNNQLIVNGNIASAFNASGANSTAKLGNNNTIINNGDSPTAEGSSGVQAQTGGTVEIGENNKVTVTGEDAVAITAQGTGSTLTVGNGTDIKSTGVNGYGVNAANGGYIKLIGDQTIYSEQSFALIALGGGGKIEADGLLKVTGDISVYAAIDVVDLNFQSGSAFKGGSFSGTGVTNPEGDTGTLTMNMTGTRWDMTKSSYVTELSMDDSHVYFTPLAAPATSLHLARLKNLADSVGGIFHMRSFIETGDIVNGGSGTNITDKLYVHEADEATGRHEVIVADRGDAKTIGTETITIIETEGGDHEFFMQRYNEQGYHLYGLRRTEADENNWELYGLGEIAVTPKTVVDTIGARYRLGLHENQTLLQRLGDLRDNLDNHGAWVKLHGGEIKGKTATLTAGYDLDYFGVQLGIDKKLQDEWLDGDVYLGLWGGYTKGDLDFYSTHTGDIKNYFVGLYATYMDETNTYADLVLRYGKQKTSIEGYSTQGTWLDGSDRTDMHAASLEVGRRYHFERNQLDEGFYFEPQAQLSLTHYGSGDMTLSSGLNVKNESFDSLVGRLGVNVGIERKYGDTPYNAYVKVSYLKEMDGDVAVRFNNDEAQKVDFGDDWWTYGVGVTAKLSDKHSIYMDIERSSASDLFKQSWRGNVGYRYTF